MKLLENYSAQRKWDTTEEQILEQVQRVCDDIIAPNAARVDEQELFPWENINALNELGLNMVFIPEQYGGLGLSYALYLEIVSLISEACASTGIIYATNYHGMKPIVHHGTEEQCERFLSIISAGGLGALAITEERAGSDATQMTTTFTEDSDEIVINGSKIFITNGDVADLTLLFGKWSGIEDPKQAISVLVLPKDAPGFQAISKEKKMGMNGSSTCTLAFDDCRVPRANLLGAPGDGLSILLSSLNLSRPSVAAHARGIARAAMKDMIDYANERAQGGKKIMAYQGNQFIVADLAAELVMLEAWLDHVAAQIDSGNHAIGLEASVAKLRASDLAMKITTECVQFFGGYGYCKDYRAERLMRDAKITQIWEGTNQIHRQFIGRSFIQR